MLVNRCCFCEEHRRSDLLWLFLILLILALPRVLTYQRKPVWSRWGFENSACVDWGWLWGSFLEPIKWSVRVVIITSHTKDAALTLRLARNGGEYRRNFLLLVWLLIKHSPLGTFQWLGFYLMLVVKKRRGLHYR